MPIVKMVKGPSCSCISEMTRSVMASSVFSYERASSHASVAGSGRDGAGGDGSGGDGAGGDGSAGSGRLLDAASPELPAGSGGGCSGGPAVAMPASAGTASSDAVPDEPASGAHEISGAGRPSTCRSYMLMSCLAKSGSKSCGSMSFHRATRPSERGGFSSRSPLLRRFLAGRGGSLAPIVLVGTTARSLPPLAAGS